MTTKSKTRQPNFYILGLLLTPTSIIVPDLFIPQPLAIHCHALCYTTHLVPLYYYHPHCLLTPVTICVTISINTH